MDNILLNGFGVHDGAIALARVGVGAFFAISGYHKLFNAERHASLVTTLTALKVPFVGFNQWWVPAVEFVGGILVAWGLFTVCSAAMLLAICFVACATDGMARVTAWKPIDKADFVDDVLYLPEAIYMILLFAIMLSGPDAHSLDKLFFM